LITRHFNNFHQYFVETNIFAKSIFFLFQYFAYGNIFSWATFCRKRYFVHSEK
jgi:hypothetical protein